MLIADLDYFAHKNNPSQKPSAVVFRLVLFLITTILVLSTKSLPLLITIYGFLILVILFCKVPLRLTLFPSFLPLVFLLFFLLSFRSLNILLALTIILKALTLSLSTLVLLVFTSVYRILAVLADFLPPLLVSSLWLTYKSLFILNKNLVSLLAAWHFRGGLSIKKPLSSLKNLGFGLGFLLIKSLDMAEKEYEALMLRGYNGRIYF
jgi:cobalt/nickel transport system permease protein